MAEDAGGRPLVIRLLGVKEVGIGFFLDLLILQDIKWL